MMLYLLIYWILRYTNALLDKKKARENGFDGESSSCVYILTDVDSLANKTAFCFQPIHP